MASVLQEMPLDRLVDPSSSIPSNAACKRNLIYIHDSRFENVCGNVAIQADLSKRVGHQNNAFIFILVFVFLCVLFTSHSFYENFYLFIQTSCISYA